MDKKDAQPVDNPVDNEATLNDELAAEARRVHNAAVSRYARVGTKHDPEL